MMKIKERLRVVNPIARTMLQKRRSPMIIPNKKKQKPKKLDRRQIDNERDI